MGRNYTGKTSIGTWRVKQKNGDIYVYTRETRYDREKKKTVVVKTTLQGIWDEQTQSVRPTRPRKSPCQDDTKKTVTAQRKRVGASEILEFVGQETGLTNDLTTAFGEGAALKISAIAQYMLASGGSPLTGLESWQVTHSSPYSGYISEDNYHDLFHRVGVDEEGMQNFFARRANKLDNNATIALDSTTISTYSANQTNARQGFNKDGDGLDTIKLVVLHSVNDKEPIAFNTQPGNIPDVISVENAIKQLKSYSINSPTVVTDNGYYSEENMFKYISKNMKFLTLASKNVKWIRTIIDENKEKLENINNICSFDSSIRHISKTIIHEFKSRRKKKYNNENKNDEITSNHRLYVHIYLNNEKAICDEQLLIKKMMRLKQHILEGNEVDESDSKFVEKYLIQSRKGRGGKLKINFNEKSFEESRKYFGFFVLVSNSINDAEKALHDYRLREKIEELFGIQKNSLDGRRPRAWYPDNFRGRLFVQFVTLCYHCFLNKRINEMKASLGVVKEGKTKDRLQLENSLRKWLEQRSLLEILKWFDCVERTDVTTPRGSYRWSTESVRRDELFLELLGMKGQQDAAA